MIIRVYYEDIFLSKNKKKSPKTGLFIFEQFSSIDTLR